MKTLESVSSLHTARLRRSWPATFWIGIAIILIAEFFLFTDVKLSHRGAIETQSAMEALAAHPPQNVLGSLARWVAIYMTPIAWLGYLFLLEGILTAQTGTSPVRLRPNHFAICALLSVPIWCLFDCINFYCFKPPAWTYIGVPSGLERYAGYAVAFAAIVPGMLMSGQVFLDLGVFDAARSERWHLPRWAKGVVLLIGAAMLAYPLLSGDSRANYTLWASLVFLLDPINLLLGRPSVIRDWQAGWYGRTLAAFAGGLLCGLLWEFWNYWAMSKWIYHLPFLGSAESVRYFQMPVIGLIGFIPFGLECWVMWQFLRIFFDGLVEPLPGERVLM